MRADHRARQDPGAESTRPPCTDLADVAPEDVLLHRTALVIFQGRFPQFHDVERHELGGCPSVRSIPVSAGVLTKREEDVRVTRIGERFEHFSPALLPIEGCANIARLSPIDFREETWVVFDYRRKQINLPPILQRSWSDEPHCALNGIWGEHPPVLRETEEEADRTNDSRHCCHGNRGEVPPQDKNQAGGREDIDNERRSS